jgi:hypothetical protein
VRGFFFVNREECLRKQLEKALEEAVSKKDHSIHELKAQMAVIEHEWENCFAKRVAQEVEQKENELRTRSRANKSEVLSIRSSLPWLLLSSHTCLQQSLEDRQKTCST